MRIFTLFLCLFAPLLATIFPMAAHAVTSAAPLDGGHEMGGVDFLAIGLFGLAYGFVLFEEKIHLRKSKPVTVAAGLIWVLVMMVFSSEGRADEGASLLRHALLEFSELMLFLLSAMTFINTMEERGLFTSVKARLIGRGLSYRALFWTCGVIAFFLSPLADNLTTALVLGAVAVSVGGENKSFVVASFVNIVVAANAGGAFSPFGDITTLMVWQKGVVDFWQFFALFLPSVVSWLIPATAMSLTIPKTKPHAIEGRPRIKKGGKVIAGLFLLTIALTVGLHQTLHIPPFLGMMTGLGLLKIYGFFIRRHELRNRPNLSPADQTKPFDIFVNLSRIEWDTMMFFYGIMLCVGGLGALGHLQSLSTFLYGTMGETLAHTAIGLLSAVIDNIPVMFAVLNMGYDHSTGQWLLVTLTAGIGGSLLSIGSAAGVALMGQARGVYTFAAHFRWTWVIALGYLAGIATHLAFNHALF